MPRKFASDQTHRLNLPTDTETISNHYLDILTAYLSIQISLPKSDTLPDKSETIFFQKWEFIFFNLICFQYLYYTTFIHR